MYKNSTKPTSEFGRLRLFKIMALYVKGKLKNCGLLLIDKFSRRSIPHLSV